MPSLPSKPLAPANPALPEWNATGEAGAFTTPQAGTPVPEPLIEVRHVSQLFGDFVALRDLTLELPAGSSVVLLGPNGAGKSTLLRLLAGLAEPAYGEIRVFGRSPRQSRGRIAYMGHSTMLYDDLTAAENLDYLLALHSPLLSAQNRARSLEAALAEVGLDARNPRHLGQYSQGMRQRTALARVLITEPDLLLLDEPFSNLDVASAETMLTRLAQYLALPGTAGLPRTLLLTTHQAELARPLARLTLRLESGRLQSQTSMDAR